MTFNDVIDKIGIAIDGPGVAVIMICAVVAFVIAITHLTRRENDVYRGFHQRLGPGDPARPGAFGNG